MKKQELIEENKRLKASLKYIMLLASKKNPHFGRPRLSDASCIYCMAFFALKNGAYGERISEEDYIYLAKKLKS